MTRRLRSARDKNEPEIIAAAEGIGARVEKIDSPVDLIISFRGHNLLVEVKNEGGKITSNTQVTFWSRPWPGPRFIVYTKEELMEILLGLPDMEVHEWGTPSPLMQENS